MGADITRVRVSAQAFGKRRAGNGLNYQHHESVPSRSFSTRKHRDVTGTGCDLGPGGPSSATPSRGFAILLSPKGLRLLVPSWDAGATMRLATEVSAATPSTKDPPCLETRARDGPTRRDRRELFEGVQRSSRENSCAPQEITLVLT